MKKAVFVALLLCAASAVAQDEVILTQVAAVVLPGWCQDNVIQDQLAYVAGGELGLMIYDMSNPLNPTLIGSRDSLGDVGFVRLQLPYAYLGAGSSGYPTASEIHILDVSDPFAPRIVATFTDMETSYDLDVYGQMMYVAQRNGLRVVDISDPIQPQTVSFLPLSASEGVTIGAGDGFVIWHPVGGPAVVVDVSDAAIPVAISSLYACYAESVAADVDVIGRLVYFSCYAYLGGEQFVIADVTDLDRPEAVSLLYISDEWRWPWGIDVKGTYAFWGFSGSGIAVVGLSESPDLYLTGQWTTGWHCAFSFAVSGAYLYDPGVDDSLRVFHLYFRARGNVNYDQSVNMADAIALVNYAFRGGPAPQPETYVGDTNCDTKINAADVLRLVAYIFRGAPKPLCD